MPEGSLHAETGPKSKLNPRSCANKEENGKSLLAASEAVDKIPATGAVNPASVEYLNRQRLFPQLRWWTLGATVDLGFAFCV